jgi:hypothetical protein
MTTDIGIRAVLDLPYDQAVQKITQLQSKLTELRVQLVSM